MNVQQPTAATSTNSQHPVKQMPAYTQRSNEFARLMGSRR